MKIGLSMAVRNTRSGGIKLLCAAAFLAALHGGAIAQDAGVEQAFKEGVDLLKRGQLEQANAKFRSVLAANPSSDDAYSLVRSTDGKVFLEMLKAKGDSAQVAERLLNLSHKAETEKSRDEAAIRALVSTAISSSDVMAASDAADALASKHGEYAVPYVVGHLGSVDVNTRAAAVMVLRRIGADAVLPLAASLGSGNDLQAQNTAKVLASIGDERAVPALLRAAKGGNAEAGKTAQALGAKATDAAAAYLDLAAKYFTGDTAVLREYDKSSAVWSMADGKLTATDVARFLYPYELAEQAAYDALAVSPGNVDAGAMIALVQFAEQAAHENLPDAVKSSQSAQDLGRNLAGAASLASSVGADGLLRAYGMAMKLKNSDAGAKVADALVGVWGGRAVDGASSLVAGLSSEDRAFRYTSAIALLRISPSAAFPGADKVATLAGQAAAERAIKQVLVLDSDSKNAMNCQRALNEAGMHAVAFTSGVDALQAAKSTGAFDAILVRSRLSDLSAFQVLDEVARDFRTSSMKTIVMAEGADLSSAEGDFAKRNITGTSPTAVDATGVVNAVKKALESAEGDASRIAANALSKRASAAIAGSSCSSISLGGAVPGLVAAAGDGADDDVRVAALGALANCATPDTQGALRGILANAANSPAVRAASASALGRALRGQTPAAETFSALLDAMGADDMGVRTAAGSALGNAKLSPAQQAEMLAKRRI